LDNAFHDDATKLTFTLPNDSTFFEAVRFTGEVEDEGKIYGWGNHGDMLTLGSALQELTGNTHPPDWERDLHYGYFKDPSDLRQRDTAEVFLEKDADFRRFVIMFTRIRDHN
jgi:hypothetical protein